MSYMDITSIAVAEIIGDFGYKAYANKGGIGNFALGGVGYIGVIFFLIRSLQGSSVLLVNSAWDGISALIESVAAMVFLGERFADPQQYIGIFLIVIGLFFLKIPMEREHRFFLPSLF
jgi:multidrug transporter EmrE-like cation transporter